MIDLNGKTAIVTGGAAGIGAACAETFHRAGANVVVADIDKDAGNAIAGRFGERGVFQLTDVSDAANMESLVEQALSHFGGLDIMINNAGISEPLRQMDFLDDDFGLFDRLMHVNLLGTFLGMKFAGQAMRERGCGSIINIASVGGLHAGFGVPIYRASKAGVLAATRNAAVELARYNIRVNSIAPGPIQTQMAASGFPAKIAKDASRLAAQLMTDMQLLDRVGQPDDIAAAALYLASDLSAQMTGQNLIVDGGQTVGDQINRVVTMQTAFENLMAAETASGQPAAVSGLGEA